MRHTRSHPRGATVTAGVGFAPSASADTRAAAGTNGRVCDSSGYKSYRCKDTAADDQGAAEAAATAGFARPYNLVNDNCLTRSVQIFKAYDGSGGLNSLPDGKLVFPNAYFKYDLDGWDAAKPL